MANQRIKANLIPSCDIYPVIHLAQYDVSDGTGKQVEIELYYGTDKFTIPSGSSITFRGTKRDKTGYSYEITKFSDNIATVDVKPQMTVLSGTHFAELRISKGNTISNTIKFVMKIDSSALADDTKVSETDLSVIEKALQASDAAIQAKAEVEKLKESVEASEKNAKQSETNASQSATNAQESAESASTSAATASTKATEASTSATKAKESETNASQSATNAQESAESAIQTKAEVEQLKKETVEQTKTLTDSAKQEISTVKDATVTEVTELKNSTVSKITSLKDSTIEAVTLLKDNAKAEADRATESSTSAKVQAEKAKASADSIANVTSDVEKLKEDLPNKITKFYASNQGETHLADSDNGKIQDMMIYGKSNQNQTRGKNLLKYPYIETTKTSNDITFTDNKDGSINVSGTGTEIAYYNLYSNSDGKRLTLASGTYKLVAKGRSTCNVFVNNGVNSAKNEGTFTITDGHNDVWCFIEAPKGLAIDETIYPMIQLASSADESYEPYTGGKPSPNPDYPQEIKNVVNPTVKLLGSNILKIEDGEYQYGGVTVTVSNGVLKLKGTANQFIDIEITANSKIVFKEGTKIIFSSNNVKGIENKNDPYLDFTNNNTIGFSIVNNNLNTPYIIKEGDTKYPFILFIRCHEGKNYDETWKPQVLIGETITPFKPYTEQIIALPITLNAIPVSSNGNVTINGQQYVADYVDVERGKVVQMCERKTLNTKNGRADEEYRLAIQIEPSSHNTGDKECIFSAFKYTSWTTCTNGNFIYIKNIKKSNDELYTAQELKELSLDFEVVYQLAEKQETDLTTEQTQALKELATYYPVTNISVNSEQVEGYTVFNYPISLANGWNYVKKQLNDNRDYIYDMDLQSAEAYVNSEYAVTLTELEV